MAKSRWEIENQGFNDTKNRYGLEHVCHHHANSILVNWLLIFLAVVIERLYRTAICTAATTLRAPPNNSAASFGLAYRQPPLWTPAEHFSSSLPAAIRSNQFNLSSAKPGLGKLRPKMDIRLKTPPY